MSMHILDHTARHSARVPLMRFVRARKHLEASDDADERVFFAHRRRMRGAYDPSARLRAFVRIDRGYRA